MNKELFLYNRGEGKLRGWKIKLDPTELGFDVNNPDDYPEGYCIPLSDDTPEFRSFNFYDQIGTGFDLDTFPEFKYVPNFQLLASKGIIYRADNPTVIYPAIGYNFDPPNPYHSKQGILHSFYPIFLNKGESIEEATSKEYIIIYDPDQSWKPKNKLTIEVIDEPNQTDTSSSIWYYESSMYLPSYNTPLDITSSPTLEANNTYEVALTGEHFGFITSNVFRIYSIENCEEISYKSQYYVLFKVLDMTKDVNLSISFYDPAA